jgi:hypothetical protein
MPQPALSQVPGQRTRQVAGRTFRRTVARILLPHRLHSAARVIRARASEQAWLLYDLLYRTSAATMLEPARDPKDLGADIGFLGVLHTWDASF